MTAIEQVETADAVVHLWRDGRTVRSDHARAWSLESGALVLLMDGNFLASELCAELFEEVAQRAVSEARDGVSLRSIFTAVRTVVEHSLERRAVPAAERFVNVALLQIVAGRIAFTGAYAPLYLCTGDGVDRITFDTAICGLAGLDDAAIPIKEVALGPGDRAVIVSDGMLESRTPAGKINGDSLINQYWREVADGRSVAGTEMVAQLYTRYQSNDSEHEDSHGLVIVEPRPSTERTLLLFKPDVYERDLAGAIEKDLAEAGIEVVERFQVAFTPDGVFQLWPRIYGRRWTRGLMGSLPKRPLDVLVLEAERAIDRVIDFKDTLRESRSQVNSYRNLLHSPDSVVAFGREYGYLRSIEVTQE